MAQSRQPWWTQKSDGPKAANRGGRKKAMAQSRQPWWTQKSDGPKAANRGGRKKAMAQSRQPWWTQKSDGPKAANRVGAKTCRARKEGEQVKKSKHTLSEEQGEMLSAALRHTRDARTLLVERGGCVASPDQSWHLAGFGLECLRKACLFERWADREFRAELGKALGHTLEETDLLDLFLLLDAHAWRYRLQLNETEDVVGEWRPEARYARTGTYQQPKVRGLVDFVEKNVEVVTALLWADGRLLDPEI